MGLDITWYRELTAAPDAPCDGDGEPVDYAKYFRVYPQEHYPERAADIAPGVYSWAENDCFRAGSYSGYSAWREQLAAMAGYPAAGHAKFFAHSHGCWETATSGPFYELINFSDCDGYIGTAVSAKLAADFAEHQPKADAIGGAFAERYALWRNAFEQAQHGGLVDFH